MNSVRKLCVIYIWIKSVFLSFTEKLGVFCSIVLFSSDLQNILMIIAFFLLLFFLVRLWKNGT